MAEWLGHRDLCPSQWGQRCTCPCADVACPGVDRCTDPDCASAIADLTGDSTASPEDTEDL